MANEVVAHYLDGRVVKGVSLDVDPGRPVCHIRTPAEGTLEVKIKDLMALFFGLIHGMGFSNFLKAMLGRNGSIWQQLLAFNIGIELGQLLIVMLLLLAGAVVLNLFHAKKRDWIMVLSSAAAGVALVLMLETSIF